MKRLLEDPLSRAWIEHQEQQKTPPNTIKRRESTLRNIGNAGAATREEVEAWWNGRTHLAPATRSNDLANLRSFYKWCQRWDHRDDDPTRRIDAPKVPNGLPRPMSRHDLHRALTAFPDDLRRAAALGAYAGMRVSEAAALDWQDVDAEAGTVDVIESKGTKSRRIAVSPVLMDALLPNTGGNVVRAGKKAYSADTLQRKVNRALLRVGIDATFHQLRHRYGTLAYQATGDLLAVGRMMGHSSVTSTAIYAQANDDIAAKIASAVTR